MHALVNFYFYIFCMVRGGTSFSVEVESYSKRTATQSETNTSAGILFSTHVNDSLALFSAIMWLVRDFM